MKKILIYGMGKTGIELARFCKRKSISFLTFDDNTNTNEEFLQSLSQCNEIITSPGVGLRNKNIKLAIKKKVRIISEIEFASRFLHKPIIAITGTNGKTTTTLLTYKLLKSAKLDVFLGGNIGTPLIKAIESQNKYDFILVEVSSFQLQFIDKSFSPFISAMLNISENHLDHHVDMNEYASSKKKIFKNQNEGSYALSSNSQFFNQKSKAKRISPLRNKEIYSRDNYITIGDIKIMKKELKLLGPHNIENILFSLNIFSLIKKITYREIKALKTFASPPHRLEKLKSSKYIINDSKSTSPQATEVAIKSFSNKIVLIMGGKDKKLDYVSLAKLVKSKVKRLILYGENKFELAKFFNPKSTYLAANLFEAVSIGLKEAKKENPLVFSPGTSSFDQFDSYTQRGETFKKYVKELS